jgi:hypothetical protein
VANLPAGQRGTIAHMLKRILDPRIPSVAGAGVHDVTPAAGQASIHGKLLTTLLFAFAAPWFLFMSGIARTALSPHAAPGFWAFAAGYLLVAVAAACVPLLVGRGKDRPLNRTMVWVTLGISSAVAIFIVVSIWNFDLDDKWVYYRVSKNILSSGLPLWNLNERALVGASFFYPYLLAFGHLFGGPEQWGNFEKIIGLLFHFAAVAVILRYFGLTAIGLVCSAALLLYEPSLQWALGGLETSLTTLWVIVAIILYMRRGEDNWLFWLMCGLLIYIRPDAILLGVGTFIGRFMREPMLLRKHIVVGLIFSVPILVYLASNQILFGFPLPLVFLVKGWNCAYCGDFPLYSRISMGMIHMLSGISVSVLLGVLLFLASSLLVQDTRLSRNLAHPVITTFPLQFDLMLGFALYLGYHVVGGYQHMNFTFRYWIPGFIGAGVVGGEIIRRALSNRSEAFSSTTLPGVATRLLTAPVAIGLLALQIVQSGFATYEGKHIDITLTVAPLRDHFSVDSYAEYLTSWYRAGHELASVVTENSRLFLGSAMMTGALTKGYLIDYFYFPQRESKYLDLRQCGPQLSDQFNCAILFDYYIALVDRQTWPSSHELWREYPTLAVLKRKDFPVPKTPTEMSGARLAVGTVELKWQPVVGDFYSEIEATDAAGQTVTKVPPGYGMFRLENVSGNVSTRMRACNDKGCSSWSAPVLVRSLPEQQEPPARRPRRYLMISIVALLGVAIFLFCIRKFDK